MAALTLTGCVKMDSVISFSQGKMKYTVNLHVAKNVISVDKEMATIVGNKEIKDLTPEERSKLCNLFNTSDGSDFSDDGLETTAREKGVDAEGRLVCEMTSKDISLSDKGAPFKVVYDGAAKEYTVTGNMGKFLGNDDTLDPSQLQEMGADLSITFMFTGRIIDYTIAGKKELPKGVTLVDDKGVKINLLQAPPVDFKIVGSDLDERTSSTPLWPFVLGGFLLVCGAAAFVVYNRSRRTSKDSNENPVE